MHPVGVREGHYSVWRYWSLKRERYLQHDVLLLDPNLCVLGQIYVVDTGGVEIDGVESTGGAVEHLQPRPLLHSEVDQHWLVLQL